MQSLKPTALINLLEEMVEAQKIRLYVLARKIVPQLTPEDLLQPQDYPELDSLPEFRYEEGILCGLESALAAIRAENSMSI